MNRKTFIRQTSLATAGIFISKYGLAQGNDFHTVRVPVGERKFTSPAVEKLIATVQKNIGNKEIAWLFGNCFPNTLDTTVDFETINGKPDTYIITGDIDAMWLRDSTAQVWPYLPLMKEDKHLQELVKGVIRRQTQCILLDPYANAFYKDVNKVSEWKSDLTTMKPGIHERKWEIDSLCYPIRLAYGYWKETGDTSFMDSDWALAMTTIEKTFREQMRADNKGPYTFQRNTSWATDGVPLGGYGYPAKPGAMIHSMFRPSDDATVFPYLIPSNFFASICLLQLNQMAMASGNKHFDAWIYHSRFMTYGMGLGNMANKYGIVQHQKFGKIYAYEVNALGSYNLMDDANIPSLLSMQYLGSLVKPEVYKRTRAYVLSPDNPFFFKGKAAEGIGGPHVGLDYIWPLSIIMRGLTSNNDAEIKKCLTMLQATHANTGFMHESFHKDDASKFTRKWFAWANTLFGEFVWKVYRERPHLLA